MTLITEILFNQLPKRTHTHTHTHTYTFICSLQDIGLDCSNHTTQRLSSTKFLSEKCSKRSRLTEPAKKPSNRSSPKIEKNNHIYIYNFFFHISFHSSASIYKLTLLQQKKKKSSLFLPLIELSHLNNSKNTHTHTHTLKWIFFFLFIAFVHLIMRKYIYRCSPFFAK